MEALIGPFKYAEQTKAFRFVRQEWLALNTEFREYACTNYAEDYSLLMTIPGIGLTIAIGILAELGNIRMFKNLTSSPVMLI